MPLTALAVLQGSHNTPSPYPAGGSVRSLQQPQPARTSTVYQAELAGNRLTRMCMQQASLLLAGGPGLAEGAGLERHTCRPAPDVLAAAAGVCAAQQGAQVGLHPAMCTWLIQRRQQHLNGRRFHAAENIHAASVHGPHSWAADACALAARCFCACSSPRQPLHMSKQLTPHPHP